MKLLQTRLFLALTYINVLKATSIKKNQPDLKIYLNKPTLMKADIFPMISI